MRFINIFWSLFLVASCQPKIKPIEEIEPPKLVIWCMLHPDSIPTAYVSQTLPVLTKGDNRKITNAQVVLFENSIAIDTFSDKGNGVYQSSKNKKIVENNIYHLTVFKQGFDKLETPKDTMPEKPVILSIVANDSAVVNQSEVSASIKLKTKLPKYYKNLGFGKFISTGLPFGLGVNTPFQANSIYGCNDSKSFYFLEFRFVATSCQTFGENYELFRSNIYAPGFEKLKSKFTTCAITQLSITYLNKLTDLSLQFRDYYSPTDVFWTPIYLPEYIRGGYGFFACYNTTDIEAQF